MAVKVRDIIRDKKIMKISNGVNIFNAMKSEFNKDQTITTFVIDCEGVDAISPFVFAEVIRQMQSRLDGQFRLELQNANPLVAQSFKMAFGR